MYTKNVGHYRWRLFANNSKIIAISGEGYKSKSSCEHEIKQVTGISENIITEIIKDSPQEIDGNLQSRKETINATINSVIKEEYNIPNFILNISASDVYEQTETFSRDDRIKKLSEVIENGRLTLIKLLLRIGMQVHQLGGQKVEDNWCFVLSGIFGDNYHFAIIDRSGETDRSSN